MQGLIRAIFHALIVLGLSTVAARAQCPLAGWAPGIGVSGTDGSVNALSLWDPDGAGPQTMKVVVGGSFAIAGNVAANNVALYDPDSGTWSTLGTGTSSAVRALAVLPDNRLVVGGNFSSAGGVGVNSIAAWNGTQWSPIGPGSPGPTGIRTAGHGAGFVNALTVLPNGHLIVGGQFAWAGSVSTSGIALWNGSGWFSIGSNAGVAGVTYPMVNALTVSASGQLFAGGQFTSIGGVDANNIARWNGSSWSPVGSGAESAVDALITLSGETVIAGGRFSSAGGVPAQRIARWDGTSWHALNGAAFGWIRCLVNTPKGGFAAGGSQIAGVKSLALWDGTTWSFDLSSVWASLSSLVVLPNGDIFAAGSFESIAGVGARNIVRQRNGQWGALSSGMNGPVRTLASLPDGDVLAGGMFTFVDGVPTGHIARWDGAHWHAFGSGIPGGESTYVDAILPLPNGDVIAAGEFSVLGETVARGIARWDGHSWSAIGDPVLSRGFALAVLPNGDIVVGGGYGNGASSLQKWNGSIWSDLGTGVWSAPNAPDSAQVRALAVLPNGDLIAGGWFQTAGGVPARNIARWDGATWHPFGNGVEGHVFAILPLSNGDIVIGGMIGQPGNPALYGVARWNGSVWSAMGDGIDGNSVDSLALLPNNDIIAVGDFLRSGTTPIKNIARWDGTRWLAVGTGVTRTPWSSASALHVLSNGDFLVGGDFSFAGGQISPFLARFNSGLSTCPADLDNGSGSGTRDCAVGIDDLLYFLVGFEAGSISIDLDDGSGTGTPDSAVTIDDLLYFLVRFEIGC